MFDIKLLWCYLRPLLCFVAFFASRLHFCCLHVCVVKSSYRSNEVLSSCPSFLHSPGQILPRTWTNYYDDGCLVGCDSCLHHGADIPNSTMNPWGPPVNVQCTVNGVPVSCVAFTTRAQYLHDSSLDYFAIFISSIDTLWGSLLSILTSR